MSDLEPLARTSRKPPRQTAGEPPLHRRAGATTATPATDSREGAGVAPVAPVAPAQAEMVLEPRKDALGPIKLPAAGKTDPALLALAQVWACNGALRNAEECREQRFADYQRLAPEEHILVGEDKLFSGDGLDFREMLEKRKAASLNGMRKYIDQLHSARNRLELHKGLRAAARRKSDLAAAETSVRKCEDELAARSALALATTPTTKKGCFELIAYVAAVLDGDGLALEALALRSASKTLLRGAL